MATIGARPADVRGGGEAAGANVRQGADRRSRLTAAAALPEGHFTDTQSVD